jgi:hypothetical protein
MSEDNNIEKEKIIHENEIAMLNENISKENYENLV